MGRVLTSSLTLLAVTASGTGQPWVLHAHDAHDWHAHAIDLAGDLGPAHGGSIPIDDHEHDDWLPMESDEPGILVVVRSAIVMGASAACGAHTGPGLFGSSLAPPAQALSTALIHSTRAGQEQCAHALPPLRTVESILRSNHALLI